MLLQNNTAEEPHRDTATRIFSAKTRSDKQLGGGGTKDVFSTVGGGSDANQHSDIANMGLGLLPSIAANKRSFGANGTMIEDLPDFDDATVVADAS